MRDVALSPCLKPCLKYICFKVIEIRSISVLVINNQLFPVIMLFYSFQPTADGSENDMRFIYCACCISYILNDWSGVDIPRVVQYIKKSRVMKSFQLIMHFRSS